MSNAGVGRWGALFDAPRTFFQEISIATELDAKWTRDESDGLLVDVVIFGMRGWLPPMWGADEKNLYLRRPEGVWRCSLPDWLSDDAILAIWANKDSDNQKRSEEVWGGLMAGARIQRAGGWWSGDQTGSRADASAIDERRHPSFFGLTVDADELGPSLMRTATEEGGFVLAYAGGMFDKPPSFELSGDFLIATDPRSGIRVAYQFPSDSIARLALDEGRLRLIFGSQWLDDYQVDAHV